MSAQHTPGPWKVFPVFADAEIRTEAGALIAVVTGKPGVRNARLIAAAPELLSIARRWAALDAGGWHVARHAWEKAQLMADTLAAIAKAAGSAS